jgi:EAL domain-containing protein (putative c-di-GMP-specific phosphodiesterase class I)
LAELDELCRRTALRSAIDAGMFAPTTVFVNVEPEVLESARLEELVHLAAQAPGDIRVVLEITERAMSARPAELLATAQRLRAAGWRLALDDVGADDMSLAFMPLLRPDIVKLDLRLVQRRPGPAVAEIMNAVNAYAERTGAVLLAEGIEDEEHLAIARALGARLGQGWLFGRPEAMAGAPVASAAVALPTVQHDRATPASPFACLPPDVPLRTSTKPLLIELSKFLEREAMRLGSTCMVVAALRPGRPDEHRHQRLPADGRAPDDLVHAADQRMYAVKHDGRRAVAG